MESKDLIIIICAIIVGACIIAGAIYFTGGLSDKDNATATNATENITNNTISVENITSKDSQSSSSSSSHSKSNSNSKSNVVNETVKYNGQADDGSYYREVSYSDGGFRQYDTSSGKLIGSSYESDQKYLPSME